MNIRNQVLLAINVRQWSSFKSLFFPIFYVLDDNKCAMYVYIVLYMYCRECKKLLSLQREIVPHLLLFWCLVDFLFFSLINSILIFKVLWISKSAKSNISNFFPLQRRTIIRRFDGNSDLLLIFHQFESTALIFQMQNYLLSLVIRVYRVRNFEQSYAGPKIDLNLLIHDNLMVVDKWMYRFHIYLEIMSQCFNKA